MFTPKAYAQAEKALKAQGQLSEQEKAEFIKPAILKEDEALNPRQIKVDLFNDLSKQPDYKEVQDARNRVVNSDVDRRNDRDINNNNNNIPVPKAPELDIRKNLREIKRLSTTKEGLKQVSGKLGEWGKEAFDGAKKVQTFSLTFGLNPSKERLYSSTNLKKPLNITSIYLLSSSPPVQYWLDIQILRSKY